MKKSFIYFPILVVLTLVGLTGCSSDEEGSVSKTALEEPSLFNVTDTIVNESEGIIKAEAVAADVDVDGLIEYESEDSVEYAGEEFYPSENEFTPHVQAALDQMDGVVKSSPGEMPKQLKPEYKDVAERLETQMSNY